MDLNCLEQKLQNHDWFYQYAEGEAYYKGKLEKEQIDYAVIELNREGQGAAAKALVAKYYPIKGV